MAARSAREHLSISRFILCLALFGEQARHIQARIHASLQQKGLHKSRVYGLAPPACAVNGGLAFGVECLGIRFRLRVWGSRLLGIKVPPKITPLIPTYKPLAEEEVIADLPLGSSREPSLLSPNRAKSLGLGLDRGAS